MDKTSRNDCQLYLIHQGLWLQSRFFLSSAFCDDVDIWKRRPPTPAGSTMTIPIHNIHRMISYAPVTVRLPLELKIPSSWSRKINHCAGATSRSESEKRANESPNASLTDFDDCALSWMGKKDPSPPEAAKRTTSMVAHVKQQFVSMGRKKKAKSFPHRTRSVCFDLGSVLCGNANSRCSGHNPCYCPWRVTLASDLSKKLASCDPPKVSSSSSHFSNERWFVSSPFWRS